MGVELDFKGHAFWIVKFGERATFRKHIACTFKFSSALPSEQPNLSVHANVVNVNVNVTLAFRPILLASCVACSSTLQIKELCSFAQPDCLQTALTFSS
jgi:hypothetical protein